MTETWLNDGTSDAALTIQGYQLENDLRKDRSDTTKGIGGGILVYSKLGEKIQPNSKFQSNDFNQYCAFNITTNSEQLTVILIYRPPGSNKDNMTGLCNIMRAADNNTVLIGDFNLPHVDWEKLEGGSGTREFLGVMREEQLEQLVDFATHNKGNILDLVISKNCGVLSVTDGGGWRETGRKRSRYTEHYN